MKPKEYVLFASYLLFLIFSKVDIGTAVVTTGGSLQAKHIIHVVSPIWNGGDNSEEEKLGLAVQNV